VDANVNLYIAATEAHQVYKVDPGGNLVVIAGNGTAAFSGDNGPAINAQLSSPRAVAVDRSGNVFIAVTFNHRVRMLDTSGLITTIAGTGTAGFRGDNGPASNAQLNNPMWLAFDSSWNF